MKKDAKIESGPGAHFWAALALLALVVALGRPAPGHAESTAPTVASPAEQALARIQLLGPERRALTLANTRLRLDIERKLRAAKLAQSAYERAKKATRPGPKTPEELLALVQSGTSAARAQADAFAANLVRITTIEAELETLLATVNDSASDAKLASDAANRAATDARLALRSATLRASRGKTSAGLGSAAVLEKQRARSDAERAAVVTKVEASEAVLAALTPPPAPDAGSATSAPEPSAPQTGKRGCDVQTLDWKSAAYQRPPRGLAFTLRDGAFSAPYGKGSWRVALSRVSFADVNQDGNPEAYVLLDARYAQGTSEEQTQLLYVMEASPTQTRCTAAPSLVIDGAIASSTVTAGRLEYTTKAGKQVTWLRAAKSKAARASWSLAPLEKTDAAAAETCDLERADFCRLDAAGAPKSWGKLNNGQVQWCDRVRLSDDDQDFRAEAHVTIATDDANPNELTEEQIAAKWGDEGPSPELLELCFTLAAKCQPVPCAPLPGTDQAKPKPTPSRLQRPPAKSR